MSEMFDRLKTALAGRYAAYIPARRASRANPMEALRTEWGRGLVLTECG